jgi:hypothetical protein
MASLAPRLLKGTHMSPRSVLFLSVLMLSAACGVGTDTVDEQGNPIYGSSATSQTQALEGVPSPTELGQTQATAQGSVAPGDTVALPQDPIPLHTGGPGDPVTTTVLIKAAAVKVVTGR